jgi:cellulose synthase operon protein C
VSSTERKQLTSVELKPVLHLYERGLYLQAYDLGKSLGMFEGWPGVDAAILAGRMANNLAAPQLSHQLHLRAFRKAPTHPEARYYFAWVVLSSRGPLNAWDWLQSFGDFPDCDDQRKADLLSLKARTAYSLRDFQTADHLLHRAEELAPDSPWIWTERSEFFERQDAYEEALSTIQECLRRWPFFRPAVQQAAHLLQLRNRNEEALDLLLAASNKIESNAVLAQLAMQQLDFEQYEEAAQSLDRYEKLAPIIEKEPSLWLAARRADVAYHLGDYEKAAQFAREAGGEFYQSFADRLRSHDSSSATRIKLPVGFVRQHHMTCAPATLTAISQFWRKPAEHLALVEEICYDGTPAHSERLWAQENGWFVREFKVTEQSAFSLLKKGIPFALTTAEATSGHLQAAIGYDQLRSTLLIRDPFLQHHLEFQLENILKRYESTGPRGMAMVPREQMDQLSDEALPESELYDQLFELQHALHQHDRPRASTVLSSMQAIAPDHRLTLTAGRILAGYDSNPHAMLTCVERLLEKFPNNANLQLNKLSVLRDLSRHQDRLAELKSICDRKDSDPVLWVEYAHLLSSDARSDQTAWQLLKRALRFRPVDSHNFYLAANLLWNRREFVQATELYRFAACLDDKKEHLAAAYFNACRHLRETQKALTFLTDRFKRFGKRSHHPAATLFWAYSELDQTTSALSVLENALQLRPDDGELLLFAANSYARFGEAKRAQSLLEAARGRTRQVNWLRAAATLADLRGDNPSALELWRQITDEEPLALDAHRSMALLLAETKGRPKALEYLEQVCSRFPHHLALHKLWNDWVRDESNDLRRKVVSRLIEINPDDAWTLRELASIVAAEGRHSEALQTADRALEVAPNDPYSHSIRAGILRLLGKNEEAVAELRKAIEISVDHDEAIHSLLNLCNSLAERKDAIEFIKRELIKQVVFGDGLLAFKEVASGILAPEQLLADLRHALQERPDLWHAWSALIHQLIDLQKLEEALSTATEATQRFPLLPRIWLDLARVHHARLDHEAEIKVLEQALQINPSWGEAVRRLAHAHERANQLHESKHVLHRAIHRSPLDAENYAHLADALWKTGCKEEALEKIEKALRLNPGLQWAWHALRNWSRSNQQPERALQMARELIKLRPGEARSYICLAQTLPIPEQVDEALSAVDQAIALNPRNAHAHDLRARLLARVSRFDEALAACHPPIWKNSVPLVLRARAAWIEHARGNHSEAIKQIREVAEEDPSDQVVWKQLADWLWSSGEHKETLKVAEKMTRLAPLDAICWGYLADAKRQTGDKKGAKEDFKRAQELDPSYAFAGLNLFGLQVDAGELKEAEQTLHALRPHVEEDIIFSREVKLAARRNDQATALSKLRSLCVSKSTDSDALYYATDLIFKMRWYSEAEKVFLQSSNLSNAKPEVGAFWIQARMAQKKWWCLGQLKKLISKGEVGRHALVAYIEELAELNRAYRQTRQLFTPTVLRRLSLYLIKKHSVWLKSEDWAWGKVGYALVSQDLYRRCANWLSDFKNRSKAEQWMLNNLLIALHRLGRDAKADEVARHALTLPAQSNTDSHFRVWVGLEDALNGRCDQAHQILKSVNISKLSEQDKTIREVAELLLSIQQPKAKWNSFDKEHEKLLKKLLQGAHWNKTLRTVFSRSLKLMSEKLGHPSPTIWGWKIRFGKSALAIGAVLLFIILIYKASAP